MLTFTTSVDKSLPIGLGDEKRLTQVLLNLVGNAIKFTDSGEARVTAKAINGHFNVSVIDTGPGIAADYKRAYLSGSIRSTARTPRPKAVPGSASPSPSRSSRCMAVVLRSLRDPAL